MPTSPSVPLFADALESSNCVGKVSVGSQRTMYIAAKNAEILTRYEEQLLCLQFSGFISEINI